MRRSIAAAAIVMIAWAGGCSSPDEGTGEVHLELVQAPTEATPGSVVPQALVVKVVDGDGDGVPGVPVSWSVRSGGGWLDVGADTSGLDGLATARWVLGLAAGSQEVGVTIYDQPALVITLNAEGFKADQIDAGFNAVCGLQGTETWCLVKGRNSDQLFRILSQVQAKTLALSDGYACVVDLAGATYCYFYVYYRPSPPDDFVTVTGLPPIRAISSGDSYFCGIDAADRTPWCWTASFFGANHVSTSLRLTSIAAGNGVGCGIAEDGTAWCWDNFDAPTQVSADLLFRQVSVGIQTACGIDTGARLYCWDRGQEPSLVAGASPVAISMGYYNNLINVQSGARVFDFDYFLAVPSAITIYSRLDFPSPVTQISGDDTMCVIALNRTVYCLGLYSDIDAPIGNWIAVPAARTATASARVP